VFAIFLVNAVAADIVSLKIAIAIAIAAPIRRLNVLSFFLLLVVLLQLSLLSPAEPRRFLLVRLRLLLLRAAGADAGSTGTEKSASSSPFVPPRGRKYRFADVDRDLRNSVKRRAEPMPVPGVGVPEAVAAVKVSHEGFVVGFRRHFRVRELRVAARRAEVVARVRQGLGTVRSVYERGKIAPAATVPAVRRQRRRFPGAARGRRRRRSEGRTRRRPC